MRDIERGKEDRDARQMERDVREIERYGTSIWEGDNRDREGRQM